MLFDSFSASYKRFKGRFVKVIIRPEATTLFFDECRWSRFPLYWTRKPRGFKEWSSPTEGADELEILSLFDALLRKLPCRRLIGAYAKPARWATVRGMGFCLCFVGRLLRRLGLPFSMFLTCLFCFCRYHGARQTVRRECSRQAQGTSGRAEGSSKHRSDARTKGLVGSAREKRGRPIPEIQKAFEGRWEHCNYHPLSRIFTDPS